MNLAWLGRGWACALFLGTVLSMGLQGCGERPGTTAAGGGPSAPAAADESVDFAAKMQANQERAQKEAAVRAAASPRVPLPAPVASAGGGRRIDLRNFPDHVHTLERQPDGTWQQVCRENKRPLAARRGAQ